MKVGDLIWIDYGPHSDVPRFLALVVQIEGPPLQSWDTVIHARSVESNKLFAVNKLDTKPFIRGDR